MLKRNSTIGIIGGGQLGRMLAHAAQKLGYQTLIWDPSIIAPASMVSPSSAAGYDDKTTLERFKNSTDVITYEFENLPIQLLEDLAQARPVYPNPQALKTGQNRLLEKAFFNQSDLPTMEWHAIEGPENISTAEKDFKFPAILKTAELGYDGKGQVRIQKAAELVNAWQELGQVPSMLEEMADFSCEISVVVARGLSGETQSFPPALNSHENHILRFSSVPCECDQKIADQAVHLAEKAARKLEITGLLAVEFFVMKDGSLRLNEMAPRPHNSGHWSMDGCSVSQFEQHIRAITGCPLAEPNIINSVTMINLLGSEILDQRESLFENFHAYFHDYGKLEAKQGRKMGHVNLMNYNHAQAKEYWQKLTE